MRLHILLFSPLFLTSSLLLAQAGSLDGSYSGNGKTQLLVGSSYSGGSAMAIQPVDQKIVVAGSYFTGTGTSAAVIRYNTDGTPDAQFGSGGTATINLGIATTTVSAVTIQPNGMILVAGGYLVSGGNWNLFLARLTINGALDGSFNNNLGFATVPNYTSVGASAMALQPDGKILVSGTYYEPGSGNGKTGQFDFGTVRFTSAGAIDNSFGQNGQVVTNPGSEKNVLTGVAWSPTGGGKIIVCGYREPWINNNTGVDSAIVVQYTGNGVLDAAGFVTGGIARFSVGNDDACSAYAITIQPDGKILLAGSYSSSGGTDPDFLIMRLNTNGVLDNSFAGNGKLGVGFGHFDIAYAIAFQPSTSQIVAAGITQVSSEDRFALCRVNSNGTLDNTFGGGGKVIANWSNTQQAIAYGVAIQANGRVVVAGQNNLEYFATMRFLGSGTMLASTDTVRATGVGETFAPASAENIKLYPNPSAGQLQVTGLPVDAPVLLTVTDLSGKPIIGRRTGQGNALLDISRLAPGEYILTITGTGSRQSLPFVKTSR